MLVHAQYKLRCDLAIVITFCPDVTPQQWAAHTAPCVVQAVLSEYDTSRVKGMGSTHHAVLGHSRDTSRSPSCVLALGYVLPDSSAILNL